MNKYKLTIVSDADGYFICFVTDDPEEGRCFGSALGRKEHLRKQPRSLWDWASLAALACRPTKRLTQGYFWSDHSKAQAALAAARVILKAKAEKPLPEWAQTALEAGWKKPRGWRP